VNPPAYEGSTGDSIRHRTSTPDVRAYTYRLLRVTTQLVKRTGATGLLILIDEAESVFTKLHNIVSREGAFRVLSALCMGKHFGNSSKAVLALTPDARRSASEQLTRLASGYGALDDEPVRQWAKMLLSSDLHVADCAKLEIRDRVELLRRIRHLYERAFGWTLPQPLDDKWWEFTSLIAGKNIPVRAVVRLGVEFMDIQRYRTLRQG
jgi:hypothetical protein